MKTIARNKKALHDYFILETFEAGIVLTGTEIKSIRAGRVNLKDSYIRTTKTNEAYIINMHIAKFKQGNRYNHDETRERKMLLHKKEILKMRQKSKQEAATIIPLQLYLTKGRAKLEIALAKGKKKHDKRRDLKDKAMKREVEKALKDRAR